MAKKKIAILGGGIGALAAAYELTNHPHWYDDYEITVYQVGWRLGGKCATGRNPAVRCRIEEHGIHSLLGFYENTFHMIRNVYDEYLYQSKHPSPFKSWREAFRMQSTVTAMVNAEERWWPFGVEWLKNEDLPGDDVLFRTRAKPPSEAELLKALLNWMRLELRQLETDARLEFERHAEGPVARLGRLFIAAYERAAVRHTPLDASSDTPSGIVEIMDESAELIEQVIRSRGFTDDTVEHLKLLAVAAAIAKGMVKDGVVVDGFESIDHHEFREWLRRHGCRHTDSAVIRSGYDACFAYLNGDPDRPSISAAVALHGGMRLWFTYKGSIFWPMEAGMAEVIFTPLYRVLSDRGVTFEFFHRVSRLRLSTDKESIDAIDIDVQATLKDPAKGYQPFVIVKDLECWPDAPLYDQLENAHTLKGDMESAWAAPPPVERRTLTRGTDFDDAILGISIGAVPCICEELVNHSAAWKRMVAAVPTVQTQAMQLWVKATASQLGFDPGTILPTEDPACVSAFVKPFDTYVDLSDIRERECWYPSDKVRQLAYFCTTMKDPAHIPDPGTDPGFPAREHERVKRAALAFVSDHLKILWPRATMGSGAFEWRLLVDLSNGSGAGRLDAQYFRANIDPSARYVLSPPGTIAARLQPDDSKFQHLFLAGDWTYTPMNSGCVEAATMSGLRAAQGVSGRKAFVYGWS